MMRRMFAAAFLMAVLSPPAHAEPEALTTLYACAAIADIGARAACYDAATGKLKAAVQSGQVSVIGNADLQALQKDVFGYAAPALPEMLAKNGGLQPITGIETTIAKLQRGDTTTFTLGNQQIWVQVDTTGNRALRVGDRVRIERRALGSYLLFPQNGGGAVRVRRIN
jgi:hypothetical protein